MCWACVPRDGTAQCTDPDVVAMAASVSYGGALDWTVEPNPEERYVAGEQSANMMARAGSDRAALVRRSVLGSVTPRRTKDEESVHRKDKVRPGTRCDTPRATLEHIACGHRQLDAGHLSPTLRSHERRWGSSPEGWAAEAPLLAACETRANHLSVTGG